MSESLAFEQPSLFAENHLQTLTLPDAELLFVPEFLSAQRADELLTQLQQDVDWQQQTLSMYGKRIPVPRLTAWYGDAGASYTWSGIRNTPRPWTRSLQQLRQQLHSTLQDHYPTTFNSVLLNFYRDHNDSVDWHADDEPELGDEPVIASISLGQPRHFELRHRESPRVRKTLELPHGSLLVMAGRTQHCWQHRIGKSRDVLQPRINLTFRNIRAVGAGWPS